jgi:UDP-N-acetylglucosamine 2-epimerase
MRTEHPTSLVAETGDVSYDVLLGQRELLPEPGSVVEGSEVGAYVFCTLHRAELTNRPEILVGVLEALERLGVPVVLAVHPRTRGVLEALGIGSNGLGSLRLVPAVGYIESLALARAARAVVTDSGGLQREAYWLGTPCITMRSETEWSETVALGANRLVAPAQARENLAPALEQQLHRWAGGGTWDRTAYGDGAAAPRIAEQVLSLVPRGG